MKRRLFLGIGAAIALLVAGAVRADDAPAETQDVPAEAQDAPVEAQDAPVETHGEVTVGGGTVSGLNESSKYQEFREIPNGFFLSTLDFGLEKNAWTFDVQAIDLLQEDQRIVAHLGKPGVYSLVLGYTQIPRWFSNTSATLFAGAGGGRELFPTTISQQLQSVVPATAIGPLLQTSLLAAQPFPDLRYRRDKAFGALVWALPVKGLSFRAAFDQELRDGTHPQTVATNFSVGADVTEFAGGTQFTTRTARLGLDYARSSFWVGGEVLWSEFHNNLTASVSPGPVYQSAYIVDNPLRATDGTPAVPDPLAPNNPAAAQLLLSAPPDTQSTWINLNGGVKFGGWGRLDLLFGMGRSQQDEAFLPFSLNSAIVPATPLVVLEGGPGGTPVSSYDGKIDLTRWSARFDIHPLRWLSVQLFGNSYDYDNKTPVYAIPNWVNTDVALANVAVEADPIAYKTTRYGLTVIFRPVAELAIDLGAAQEIWDRKYRPTPRTSEDILSFGIAWVPASWGRIRLAFRDGNRTYDSYEEDLGQPPGFREFDLANRDQKRYDLLADFTPIERFSFGVQLHALEDDYPQTGFGRTVDKSTGWAVDFSVDAGRGVFVSGDYGQDTFEWTMKSEYRANPPDDPLNDWSTSPDDRTTSYGLGVNAGLIKDRLTLDARGNVTSSVGSQPATFVPGGAAQGNGTPFPDVTNKLVTLDATLTWAIKKALAVAFAFTHETWTSDNFQQDVMQPWMGAVDTGASESVYLGMRVPNYDTNWARVLLSYSF